MIALIFGVAAGALFVSLLLPRATQFVLRRVIVKTFVEMAPTTPFHLHNGETFFRLITEGAPWLRDRISLATSEKALKALKQIYPMVTAPVRMETELRGLADFLQQSGAMALLNDAGVDLAAVPEIEVLEFGPASHHGSRPPAGCTLPGEQEPLDGVLLSWPINYPTRWSHHARFASHIAEAGVQPVVLAPSIAWLRIVRAYLAAVAPTVNARFLPIATDDVWIRDFGPHFVKSKEDTFSIVATPYAPSEHNFQKHDNASQVDIARAFGLPFHFLPLIIEGGNLVTDGAGTMVMFDSVFAHNPERTIADIEHIVRDWFGIDRLILFPALEGEVTGHIDMAVKFVDPGTVLVADVVAGHPWKSNFDGIAARLAATPSSRGAPYRVVRAPAARTPKGRGHFWSYVNSLTVNKTVILPFFNSREDERAIGIYRSVGFEKVVGIDFRDFPLGSVHCQSKEIPAGVMGARCS
jgi:agmatine deiminase